MDNYDHFSKIIKEKLSKFPLDIKLFHLHFTIQEHLESIQLLNEELKIHQIFLPPNYIQKQTVYKHKDLSKILEMANKLFNEPKITLIGTKLECLVATRDLLDNNVHLEDVNYIEIHLKDKEFKQTNNFSQLLSYSFKNKCIANAVRLTQQQIGLITDVYLFYNEKIPYLVEVSIYDHWFKNAEVQWFKFHAEQPLEHVNEYLNKLNENNIPLEYHDSKPMNIFSKKIS